MPGPGKKRKPKANQATSKQTEPSTPAQCLALEEDEITRCGQPATEGYPKPDRCNVHHAQYCTLYKKYKDASKVVDQVKNGAALPTKEQIGRIQDWKTALDKARWVRKYLEAIRVEKAGREIHQKRFFLKGACIDTDNRQRHCSDYIFSGRWSQAPPKAARKRDDRGSSSARRTSGKSLSTIQAHWCPGFHERASTVSI